ncbi:MAG: hypothetical protein IPI94_14355 [Propionivibrio sp.]|nr:hypothetical protein [Propionivibrio sp.]
MAKGRIAFHTPVRSVRTSQHDDTGNHAGRTDDTRWNKGSRSSLAQNNTPTSIRARGPVQCN